MRDAYHKRGQEMILTNLMDFTTKDGKTNIRLRDSRILRFILRETTILEQPVQAS